MDRKHFNYYYLIIIIHIFVYPNIYIYTVYTYKPLKYQAKCPVTVSCHSRNVCPRIIFLGECKEALVCWVSRAVHAEICRSQFCLQSRRLSSSAIVLFLMVEKVVASISSQKFHFNRCGRAFILSSNDPCFAAIREGRSSKSFETFILACV